MWEETSQNQTTQSYRHGRCQLCAKPVSTTNLNPREELTCFECKQFIAEHEGQENVSVKESLEKTDRDDEEEVGMDPEKGCERSERDDEEEWGRIPSLKAMTQKIVPDGMNLATKTKKIILQLKS
jgi:hypothetical protein